MEVTENIVVLLGIGRFDGFWILATCLNLTKASLFACRKEWLLDREGDDGLGEGIPTAVSEDL